MTEIEITTLDKLRQAAQMLSSTAKSPITAFWDSKGRHDRQTDGTFKLVDWNALDIEAGAVIK